MKKRIYQERILKEYPILGEFSMREATENEERAVSSQKSKMSLFFKTLGLIFLLLFGPSFFALFFGSHLQDFSLFTRVILTLICNFIILGIIIFLYRDTLIRDFKRYFNRHFFENFELSFKYWLVGFLVMVVSNFLITIITNGGIAGNEDSVRSLIDLVPLYMLFDVAIYAPLTEELIFRKSIRDFISNKWIYVLVSGLVFGGLHVISSVESWMDLLYLIPYSALGVSFALLYIKSDNIFSSICMHALHNTMAIILYLL